MVPPLLGRQGQTVADARNRDYPVEVPADYVASFDHEAHNFALKHIEKILGAKMI